MSDVYAKMSSKGQITLPVGIRKALRVKEGDYVAFNKTGDGYLMTKIINCPDNICPVCNEEVLTSGNYTYINGALYHLQCGLTAQQQGETKNEDR